MDQYFLWRILLIQVAFASVGGYKCPPTWVHDQELNICILLTGRLAEWGGAAQHCRQLEPDSALLRVQDSTQAKDVISTFYLEGALQVGELPKQLWTDYKLLNTTSTKMTATSGHRVIDSRGKEVANCSECSRLANNLERFQLSEVCVVLSVSSTKVGSTVRSDVSWNLLPCQQESRYICQLNAVPSWWEAEISGTGMKAGDFIAVMVFVFLALCFILIALWYSCVIKPRRERKEREEQERIRLATLKKSITTKKNLSKAETKVGNGQIENLPINNLQKDTPHKDDNMNDVNMKQNNLSKGVRRAIDFDEESTNSYVPPLPPKMDNLEPSFKRLQSYSVSDTDYEPYDSGYSSNPSSEEVLNSYKYKGNTDNVIKPQVHSAYSSPHRDFSYRTNLQYDVPPSQYLLYDRPTLRMAHKREVTPLYDRPISMYHLSPSDGSSLYDRPISMLPNRMSSIYDRPTLKVAGRKDLTDLSTSPSKDPNAPPLPPRKQRRRDYHESYNHGYISDTMGYTSDDTDDIFTIGSHTISRSPLYRNPPNLFFPEPPTYPPPPPHLDTSVLRNYHPDARALPPWNPPPKPARLPADNGFRNPCFSLGDDHPSAFKVISPERDRHDTFRSDSTGSVYIPFQRESLV